MRKFLRTLPILALLFVAIPHAYAGLSEGCYPAVQCDAGQDYYGTSCQKHIDQVIGSIATSCAIANPANQVWNFSCTGGCFLSSVSVPSTNPCPAGVMVAGNCLATLPIVNDSIPVTGEKAYKIWDSTTLTEVVHVGTAGCADNEAPVSDAASPTGWKCGNAANSGLWSTDGTNVWRPTGKVGIGTATPSAGLHVKGNGWDGGNATSFLFLDTNAVSQDAGLRFNETGTVKWHFFNYGTDDTLNIRDNAYNAVIVASQSASVGVAGSTMPSGSTSFAAAGALEASGDTSIAMGSSAKATAWRSVAIGESSEATGLMSYAFGFDTTASAQGAVAIGYTSTASGTYSVSLGNNSVASGNRATAMGIGTLASGQYTTSTGAYTDATGFTSTAMGYQTTASGPYATTTGNFTTASGTMATAMGYYTTAQSYASVVIGQYNVISGTTDSWVATDPLFVVGNGTSTQRKDGLTLFKNGAFVTGFDNVASGANSVALGEYNDSTGNKSITLGTLNESSGTSSVALGQGNLANKAYAISMGYVTSATGSAAVAMGSGSDATADSAIAMGDNAWASGTSGAVAMGSGTKASGAASLAAGQYTTASGLQSTALGQWSTASGFASVAAGYSAEASGTDAAVALGYNTQAYGTSSVALGDWSVASGSHSTAMGNFSDATGDYSTAIGDNVEAQAYNSFVIGRYNLVSGTTGSWVSTEPLFVIGNGTASATRSNAVTVLKNGYVGIGTATPGAGLHIKKSGWPSSFIWLDTINSGSDAGIRLYEGGNVKYHIYNDSAADYLRIHPDGWAGINIGSTGRVGMGGDVGSANLTVYGTAAKPGGGTWLDSSDIRLKDVKSKYETGLSAIAQLDPIVFSYKADNLYHYDSEAVWVGASAQEVQKVIPDAVVTDDKGYLMLSLDPVIWASINAIKELKAENDELKAVVCELKPEAKVCAE